MTRRNSPAGKISLPPFLKNALETALRAAYFPACRLLLDMDREARI